MADYIDNPNFAGLVFQHYHVYGDERLECGSPEFMPASVGEDLIRRTLERAETSDGSFDARPVFWGPM